MLGSKVKVTTKRGDTFEAELFAFDDASNTVVLRQTLDYTTAKCNLRMLSVPRIQSIDVRAACGVAVVRCGVSLPVVAVCLRAALTRQTCDAQVVAPPAAERVRDEHLPPVRAERLHEREAAAYKRAVTRQAHIGHGVSPQAQKIFDAIVKTCVVLAVVLVLAVASVLVGVLVV